MAWSSRCSLSAERKPQGAFFHWSLVTKPGPGVVPRAQARASGGLRRGNRGRGAELAATAGLFFDLPAQLAGQVLEPVQGGIDADVGGVALDREALSNRRCGT